MAHTRISSLHWKMILEGIYSGMCVPFLGAGANAKSATRNYGGLPLGGEVALRIIESLIGKPVNRADELAKVTGISKDLQRAGLAPDLVRLGLENLSRVALHFAVQAKERVFLVD